MSKTTEGLTMNQLAERNAEYVTTIEQLQQKLIESERYGRQTDITIDNLEMKLAQMAAENAYLLNGAARELNTSWMFHKTMLGAQAALVCLSHGYQAAAREWLEGTTDEAGAEIPDDISVGELHEWFESNMVSNDGKSGFLTRGEAEVKIRAECPATDAIMAEVRASGLEMLADFCATANNGYEIHPDIEEIRLFAAQLRKGVQS